MQKTKKVKKDGKMALADGSLPHSSIRKNLESYRQQTQWSKIVSYHNIQMANRTQAVSAISKCLYTCPAASMAWMSILTGLPQHTLSVIFLMHTNYIILRPIFLIIGLKSSQLHNGFICIEINVKNGTYHQGVAQLYDKHHR